MQLCRYGTCHSDWDYTAHCRQEFLLSDYLKATAYHNYHIPSVFFLHRHITSLVSAYLHYGEFLNGPCTTSQLLLKRLEQYPLLAYVASSWHLHIVEMYETWSESEEDPPDIDTFISLFDDSEENLLAQRSRRQVSYFVKDPRDALKHSSWGEDFYGSSELEELPLDTFSSPFYESETNLVTQHSRGHVSHYGTDLSDATEGLSQSEDSGSCFELEEQPLNMSSDASETSSFTHCSRRQVSYFGMNRSDDMENLSQSEDSDSCSELEEQPLNMSSSSESETNSITQRSRRQVSYFGTDLSDAMEYLSQEHDLCQDIGGFVSPRYCAGPSWLVAEERLLENHPWQALSDIPSIEELDYLVYPLISGGPASLVRDLLRKLPQFKDRPLFYFGTPLMISISANKTDTIKMLLQELRVDVNKCAPHHRSNHETVSPIFLASKYGLVEAVELLLQCGSNTVFPIGQRLEWLPGPPSGDSHCHIIVTAVNHGHADILQILINHGVDVNTRSSISGETVFHAAIRYGRIDSVEVLVNAGCDISPRSQGKTPLDLALSQQSSDLVQYLLDKGASFDQCLPHGFEDLSWAVGERWYPEAREYLAKLESGANSQQDSDNNEVAHLLMAGLWTATSAERHELVTVGEYSPREPYISSPPIAGSAEKLVRRLVFTTVSHDQGATPRKLLQLITD